MKGRRKGHRSQRVKGVQVPVLGEVVILKGEEKNRNQRKLGKVVELIYGRDGEVRGAKVQTGKGVLERTTQHLFPLELKGDHSKKEGLNFEASLFRPKLQASEEARKKIQAVVADEQDSDEW